ncbi:MAG: tryptophan synthase subunit alpha [Acidobacteria bacterium]|nr:MAG: tryptophan synthase subunit alpha [Acidobacteriota bacterium]
MPFHFDRRPSLVAYLTCGDPDLRTTREVALAAIEAGAEVIELGVPFSDPVADGPVIQRASERALKNGVSLEQVLKLAQDIRRESEVGLIVFSYLNPVVRMGLQKFVDEAANAGVDGALITDLPSTDQRLKRIAETSTGFIYAISRTGITGARKDLTDDAQQLVKRLRKFTDLPIAVGFGISSAEHFKAVGKFADAAVVGSAIVQTIEQNPGKEAQAVAEWIKQVIGHRSSAVSP